MDKKRILSLALLLVVIGALACFPLVTEKDSDINLLIIILLYVILASSWNILGGYTGQTNLGHAAFFGIGSLTARSLWIAGVPFPLCFVIAGLAATALALVIGFPAFKLRGVYFAIGTLAMAQALYITVGNALPEMSYNPAISDYQLAPRYYLFLVLALVTIGAAYILVNSRLGLGMKAVREEEDAAESLGISALRHKLLALSVSAFFAGLAGGAFAYYHVSYYPSMPFGPLWTFDTLMMAYIGGTGTIIGPIVGSVFFVLIKELLVLNVGEYHLIIFGTLFILVVLFLPGGIVEAWEKIQKALRRWSQTKEAHVTSTTEELTS
jgi:branched-chain amino acid transport system permease protein